MTTFATMKTRIVDETLRDDLTPAQLGHAINDAIALQEGERYSFNVRRYRILTVAAQEYYDIKAPALLTSAGTAVGTGETLLELDSITTTVSNRPYPLTPRTQQWMDEQQDSNFLGQPADYTIYGQQLRIFPVPDAAYPIDLSGLARLAPNPLSQDAHTNAWMTEGERLIRAQAKVLIYRDILRDPDGVALATQQFGQAQLALKRKMAAQAYTGHQRHRSL